MTSLYSTATFSISYVEFHWVLTLQGISHIWREWVAQASFHVGRTMVVEWTMAKGSLWTYSSNGHECKGEGIIETYKFTLFSIVQTASVLLINSPLSLLSKSASRSLYNPAEKNGLMSTFAKSCMVWLKHCTQLSSSKVLGSLSRSYVCLLLDVALSLVKARI